MKVLSLLASALLAAGLLHPAHAAQYWLSASDPALTQQEHTDTQADYMDLFPPAAPWQRSAQHLGVFKIFAQSVLFGSDDMLRTIFDGMRRRHVAMAIEMGSVLRTPECGGGEGFAPPHLIDNVAGKLRRLGLVLDYWAMDEPLERPHFVPSERNRQGGTMCMYPVPEVARRVAINVARMRQYFPNIQIGTIDLINARDYAGPVVVRDNVAFADEFLRQTGRPLAFWHADIAWQSGDWRTPLAYLVRQLRTRNIRYGVIIGGTSDQQAAGGWIDAALRSLRGLVADPAVRPDDVIVQSWQSLPSRVLPENDPEAMTYELLQAERIAG